MRIADAAWRNVDTTTIRNCWRKARILPEMDSSASRTIQPSIPVSSLLHDPTSETDPVAQAEKQVEAALDDLVATGALQGKNRMDIESLLNPADESQVLTGTSDEDIYQAVMDSIAARENIEINGGDDVNEDDIPIEPRPTRRDVLKAASTINKYLDDLDNPVARKLEALLGSFNRQLRLEESQSTKETAITDFFQRS
jgi:hypothetical protein